MTLDDKKIRLPNWAVKAEDAYLGIYGMKSACIYLLFKECQGVVNNEQRWWVFK